MFNHTQFLWSGYYIVSTGTCGWCTENTHVQVGGDDWSYIRQLLLTFCDENSPRVKMSQTARQEEHSDAMSGSLGLN